MGICEFVIYFFKKYTSDAGREGHRLMLKEGDTTRDDNPLIGQRVKLQKELTN
jgi:hypothetical protein